MLNSKNAILTIRSRGEENGLNQEQSTLNSENWNLQEPEEMKEKTGPKLIKIKKNKKAK